MSIAPLESEFARHATESRFLHHHLAQTQSELRFTILFCSAFYLAFGLTDVAVLGYGPDTLVLFIARLSVAIAALAGAWLTLRHPLSIGMTRFVATAVPAMGMATFMLVAAYRHLEFHWHAMSMAIMLIVVYLYIPNRLIYSTAVAVLASAAFVLLAWQRSLLSPKDMLTMTMLLVLANTFGVVAARRFQRVSREEFRAQSILKNAAVRDHLTGCFNRRYLHDSLLNSEITRAQRFGHCVTVIVCDLDHFKLINDTHGHSAGDAVLRAFSDLLLSMTREHVDSVIRYGGEEFLLILPETDLAGGVLLAERLRSAFSATVASDGTTMQHVATTASFGVASVDFSRENPSVTLHALIAAADGLMYTAKNNGRNRVESVELG